MYMSPEMIKNDRPSRLGAMDIWAMGCVILEAATGRKPWSNLDNEWCVQSSKFRCWLTISRAIMFHIGVATKHPPLPEPGQLSSLGIDFIRKCLIIDGLARPTAADLQNHPWILDIKRLLAEEDFISRTQSPIDDTLLVPRYALQEEKEEAEALEESESSPDMSDQPTPRAEYPIPV